MTMRHNGQTWVFIGPPKATSTFEQWIYFVRNELPSTIDTPHGVATLSHVDTNAGVEVFCQISEIKARVTPNPIGFICATDDAGHRMLDEILPAISKELRKYRRIGLAASESQAKPQTLIKN